MFEMSVCPRFAYDALSMRFRARLDISEFFRGIVGLDRFGLDDHGSVSFLVLLRLVGNRPRHVTTRQHYRSHNDCHNR